MSSGKGNCNPDGTDWTEIRALILSRLDVAAEWQRFGLRIKKGARPDADGWLSCHALDRADKKPSCSINVKSGYYKTFTSDPGIRFWDAAVKYAGHADYMAAVRHYAAIANVTLPSGGGGNGGGGKAAPSSTWTAPPKKEEKPQPSLHALIKELRERAQRNGDLLTTAKSWGWRMDAVQRMHFGSPDPKDRKFYPAKKGEKYIPRIYSPECDVDADGRPTQTSLFGRSPTKDPTVIKVAMRRKRRGLTIPDGILRDANRTGILFGTEGSSDTCTLLCMRLGAVAYYSAGSGGHPLARLIKRAIDTGKLRPDIRIVLTIDNDNYGRGWKGTANVGTTLANVLGMPIYRVWMDHNPDHEDGDTKIVAPEKPDPRYDEEDYYGCGTGFATRPTPRYDPSKSSSYKDVREWFAAEHGSAFGWTDEQAIAAGKLFCDGVLGLMDFDHSSRQDDDIRIFRPQSTEVVEEKLVTTENIERRPARPDHNPLELGEVVPQESPIKDCGPDVLDVPAVTAQEGVFQPGTPISCDEPIKSTEVAESKRVTSETRGCIDLTPDHNPLLLNPDYLHEVTEAESVFVETVG
ncbi:MAG: hypothetical protein K8U57_06750 [Planctomycetes bacterium]|nr:hypothetical protein [Planctomycetota bacterium]